ncbi:MAG: enoyl-CoA hydratase/isomerase family protein [Desulfurococcales archaeon]|nr:enoyl-CoA hydratase/isomerase family protein [Desulfurococcales archaeon]
MAESLVTEETNNIYVIKLNRPEKLNALNEEIWVKLGDHLEMACNGGYKAVILTGEGRAFSAGDDIKAMYDFKSVDDAKRFFSKVEKVIRILGYCGKPVIVILNGIAVGGGAELLFLADVVIGLRGAWISYPEAYIGLVPPILLTLGLSVVGPKAVKYLALTGHRLSVDDAYRIGLVDYIADSVKEAFDTALVLAESMSRIPSNTIAEIKRIVMRSYEDKLKSTLDALIRLVLTPESKRLMYEFINKRKR